MSGTEDQSIFSTMCRLCLSRTEELVRLYPNDDFNSEMITEKIVESIERFTTVKIHPWDKLPQKICESCVRTIKSMLAFQNKCKQNNDQLQKMIRDQDESKGEIEILDTKEIYEVVEVEENDSKGIFDVVDASDETDTKETFELLKINVSEPKVILDLEVDKSETEENTDADVDDVHNYSEDDNFKTKTRNIVKNMQKVKGGKNLKKLKGGKKVEEEVNGVKNTERIPKSRLEGTTACHICGKRYHNYKMKYHINMHEGIRPFACKEPNCTSTFTAPYELKTHIRECHYRKAEWVCDVCGRAFKRKPALKVHLSYHFDPQIPCTVCEKLFKNNRALTKHMLVHSQERKFKCDTCEKSFQTRYTLRIHKRVHTQEKPYSCHCGVSFAYNCLLKAHTEKYHKKGKETKS